LVHPNRSIDRGTTNDWLDAHNDAREALHYEYGVPFSSVQWADSLEDMAQENADELVQDCVNRIITTEPATGQNVMMAQGTTEFQTPETVMDVWMSKWDNGHPANMQATQVVWWSTDFIGCAQAKSPPDTTTNCTVSVCLYSRPGNCAINEFNWDEVTFDEDTSCDPFCPPGYTNTTARYSTDCVEVEE
jgi:hypothetical protein